MRCAVLALAGALLVVAPASAAEKQIKPFIAVAFAGSTTYVPNLEEAAGEPHFVLGIGTAVLWDVFGVDAEVAHAPGFFQSDSNSALVLSSAVTTITGNVVLTLPRRLTEYILRPYFVGGAGFMRARAEDVLEAVPLSENLAVIDVGGGATGFITDRVGIAWEARYFRTLKHTPRDPGLTFGPTGQVTFWRASMALVYRY